MAESEVITVRFLNDLGGGSSQGSSGGSVSSSSNSSVKKELGSIATEMGSLSKLLGEAGLILEAANQLLVVFRPAVTILQMIARTLVEFLRPIADIFVFLLQPILLILRPILMVFREMLAPFRKLAYTLLGQSAKARASGDTVEATKLWGLGISTLMQGLNLVTTALFGEILKQFNDMFGQLFKSLGEGLIKLFGAFLKWDDNKINDIIETWNTGIDRGVAIVNGTIDGAMSSLMTNWATTINALTENENTPVKAAVYTFAKDLENMFGKVFASDPANPVYANSVIKLQELQVELAKELDDMGVIIYNGIVKMKEQAKSAMSDSIASPIGERGWATQANEDYNRKKKVDDILLKAALPLNAWYTPGGN